MRMATDYFFFIFSSTNLSGFCLLSGFSGDARRLMIVCHNDLLSCQRDEINGNP